VTTVQLTSSPPCGDPWDGSSYPALDAKARKVAFVSLCDLVPGKNTDGSAELFIMNVDGTDLRQLTSSAGGFGVLNTSMDPKGNRVVFASDRDLVPGANTDGNMEIFEIGSDGMGLRQLTSSTGGTGPFPGSSHPRFDPTGARIVFPSNRDLVPGGNPDGNSEIFVMNANGDELKQLTHTSGQYGLQDAELDATGTKLIFAADQDLVPGSNPDQYIQLFVMNTNHGGVVQLTNTNTGTGAVAPHWTRDGNTVVFSSDNDLTGGNPDLNFEVFRMNADGSGIVQLTYTAGDYFGARAWSISPDAKTIAIHSGLDLVPGANLDKNFEVFLMTFKP
jgi:Tol biopolymer transport system component